MGYRTGTDGYLEEEGRRIGRVVAWSVSSDVELNDTSKVGDCERSYESGARTITGSASIWYYNDEPSSLMEKALGTSEPGGAFKMCLGWGDKKLVFDALLTRASVACEIGSAVQAQIAYQVSGGIAEAVL